MESLLSLAIVTLSSEISIKDSLDSLIEHLPHSLFPEVIVVDNRSTDRTVGIIQKYSGQHGNITLIGNAENVGFGRTHSQALAAVASHYHVIYNPDIIVSTDIFTPLVDFIPYSGKLLVKQIIPDS